MPMSPTREEFHALARDRTVIPVRRELLADLVTPVAAFARLTSGGEAGFLLESVEHGERWGRWSFVGRRPVAVLTARGTDVEVTVPDPADPNAVEVRSVLEAGPLDRGVLAAVEPLLERFRAVEDESLPPLHGGLVGYLGYDVVREVEDLPDAPPGDAELPDAIQHIVGELAAFDHFRQRVVLIANAYLRPGLDAAEIDARYDAAVARLDRLARDGAAPLDEPLVEPPRTDEGLPEVEVDLSASVFEAAVDAARAHIDDGEIEQIVLSRRFSFDLDADPFDLYRVLRQINPSPYMYLFRHDDVTLVGSSPEPMVKLRAGRVVSRPIAGTRRRGATEEEDRRLGAELREDPKEVAEHEMLIDLARHDLARVVRDGSLEVSEHMTLERYSHVMHLTSQVEGDLAADRGPVDVLRATLPAGTVSGAPKVRAMELIDRFEPNRRGPYAGVVGYIDLTGNIDTAIAIRTMVCLPDGRAFVQAGAGIVADSVPHQEELETRNKARALLTAVPTARRMTADRRR